MRLAPLTPVVALCVAALGLASCQTPCVSPYAGPVRVSFECQDESRLEVTFSRQPDSALVVQEGFAPVTLPALITGSGYRYGDEGVELRGTGGEARMSRPGGGETVCREVPAPVVSAPVVPATVGAVEQSPRIGAEHVAPAAATRNYCRA